MKKFDIFNRWSFNLLVLFFLGFWLIFPAFYLFDLNYKGYKEPETYSLGLIINFIETCILYQGIAFITTIILLILERKPDFRIKKIFITKIIRNLFYKIISILIILTECLLIGIAIFFGIKGDLIQDILNKVDAVYYTACVGLFIITLASTLFVYCLKKIRKNL